ncbi:nucleotidyltransferase domain-containing protein [Allorhizocola rhizosphaerae]|uniref:nucleotidyltransferase domain-containing protein n=1 Tax=Allorhizocola rhizosphaerae TaxID=1872709 RepID=UPI001B8B0623|nr:nucleotidyltransferase domain-containing protein [Allorhizocola rhizosphaerae]
MRYADELVVQGAQAVVLVGSVARGDALPTSDVDLIALGSGPAYRLLVRDGRQVSVSWRTAEDVRASFLQPAEAGGAVPAWRGAVVLADPTGEAARLRAEAHAWDWSQVGEAADAWVAEQITGYAEEVHRLVGQAGGGSPRAAAVVRCVLALRMAVVLAVHHRILYDSENRLWDLVAEAEGPRWTRAQDRALGVVEATVPEANRAALDLYAMTAARTEHLLVDAQREVVRLALAIAA